MAHRHVNGVSPYHSRTRIHAVRTDKPGQAARGLPRRSSSVSFLSEADQSSIIRTPETLPGSAGAPDCIAEYPQGLGVSRAAQPPALSSVVFWLVSGRGLLTKWVNPQAEEVSHFHVTD